MNLRMNPSSPHKIHVKFVEVVYFQQIFRLQQPPTLPKMDLLANRHFSSIHLNIALTTIQEMLVAASVICANVLETRKK